MCDVCAIVTCNMWLQDGMVFFFTVDNPKSLEDTPRKISSMEPQKWSNLEDDFPFSWVFFFKVPAVNLQGCSIREASPILSSSSDEFPTRKGTFMGPVTSHDWSQVCVVHLQGLVNVASLAAINRMNMQGRQKTLWYTQLMFFEKCLSVICATETLTKRHENLFCISKCFGPVRCTKYVLCATKQGSLYFPRICWGSSLGHEMHSCLWAIGRRVSWVYAGLGEQICFHKFSSSQCRVWRAKAYLTRLNGKHDGQASSYASKMHKGFGCPDKNHVAPATVIWRPPVLNQGSVPYSCEILVNPRRFANPSVEVPSNFEFM